MDFEAFMPFVYTGVIGICIGAVFVYGAIMLFIWRAITK